MMMDEKTTKSKIYKRATLHTISVKTKKEESRKRNVILNFRVSEKEKELIEKRIELSGLKKSEFFIQSCLYQVFIDAFSFTRKFYFKHNCLIRTLCPYLSVMHLHNLSGNS